MQLSEPVHQTPLIIFDSDAAWQECLCWCLHQYGSTDWQFHLSKDLFGRHECTFKFLSAEDLVQFLLAWYNVK